MGILNFLFGIKAEKAKPISYSEQPVPPVTKETADWRNSKPHLLLLSRFLYAQKAKDAIPPHWEGALGEPPQRAVDRFILEGWLVPASLFVKLDRTFNATEIKKLLKEHGLPSSGRKEQGIARLVRDPSEDMTPRVAHLDIVECSSEARAIAEQFVANQKAEREAAERKSLERLHLRDSQGAIRAVAQFEEKQVFPRGLGIDWKRPCTEGDGEFLKMLFESRPKILTGLSETEWEPLKVAAAMMHLWGTNSASNWHPTDFVGIPRFDHDTAVRMVLFNGQHRRAMAGYFVERNLKVEILGSSDPCPECKRIAGKTYSSREVPELPYEKCTHEMGCRCEALPVI